MGSTANTRSSFLRHPDFRPIVLLLGIYLLLQVFTFHLLGRFIVDAGKELVVPWQLLDGQILYRDIFWIYGPWAPYFNAVTYAIFGVHADSLLWVAKLLGAGVLIGVYRCLSSITNPHNAFWGALSILAFSTTSNYFAWPYSFSNLWATCLALFAVDSFVRWQRAGKVGHLVCSALCTIIVFWSKFIIALPVLTAIWSMVIFTRFDRPADRGPKTPIPVLPAVLYTGAVLGAFFLSVWFFGRLTEPETYRLQLGAVFHARHLMAAGLYDRLREVIFLQNGTSAENLSAALAVLISPLAALFSVFTWLHFWFRRISLRGELVFALPYLAFAIGNLLQMNSSVHAPYVFPALIIPLLHTVKLWRDHSNGGRKAGTFILAGTVGFCLLLGAGRVAKVLANDRGFQVSTPRFKFRWSHPHGPQIQAVADEIRENTSPEDRIVVFSSHDFLYLLSDRKPGIGYFYTWYEAFHDPQHSERVQTVLKSPEVKLAVTHVEDGFALVFAEAPRSHPIYQTLRAYFEPELNRNARGGFVIWRKKTVRPETQPADRP